jgi:hypothetical protein
MTRPSIAVSDLDFHLLGPGAAHRATMRQAYELWRDGWGATLRDVCGLQRIHSDEFTRQDEIVAMFHAGTCIAVSGLRWLDLSLPMARDDSYFGCWPEPAIVRLERSLICISSNTLIAPAWRGTRIELGGAPTHIPLKLAMIGLPLKRYVESRARFMVGVTRNDRAMDRTSRELGFFRLATIQVHGIDSDVVAAERSSLLEPGPAVEELWRRRRVENGAP